jgi:4-hydroxy-tetrahydrodipicolinate synthase
MTERALSGLALLTEVGEAAFLEGTERRTLVERVAKRAEGKLPFWVQIGEAWTRSAVEAAQHAEQTGAAGLLLALPRLPGIGYAELYRHVDRVARATSAPLVLVARPADIVTSLAPEEQGTLAKHLRLAGVFVAEGGAGSVRSWARRFEGRGEIWTPSSFELTETAKAGATGVLCTLATLAPDPAKAMIDGMKSGDMSLLRQLEKRMRPVLRRMGPPRPPEAAGGVERLAERIAGRPLDGGRLRPLTPPALLKEGLRLQGHRLKAFVRPPQPQISDEEREKLKSLLRASGLLA